MKHAGQPDLERSDGLACPVVFFFLHDAEENRYNAIAVKNAAKRLEFAVGHFGEHKKKEGKTMNKEELGKGCKGIYRFAERQRPGDLRRRVNCA